MGRARDEECDGEEDCRRLVGGVEVDAPLDLSAVLAGITIRVLSRLDVPGCPSDIATALDRAMDVLVRRWEMGFCVCAVENVQARYI